MRKIEEIEEDFSFLDDWEDRYSYVIELGRELPPLASGEKKDETKVRGCASQVWLVAEGEADGRIRFRGESDAQIVQGLIALLIALLSGKRAGDVARAEPHVFFERVGLAEHLTPQRSNGLASMIARLKNDAARMA